ncbi:hypothetical protein Tco_0857305 [Tanacetum coccineum]|uniref:Retrovirus-related Pol polyprotein from transposon TNT 1-94-like beta-barrel domain-containing protein n=1 Tax=Tanacetum coccineum TaxID=301880 RepID=A0ABQ5B9T4_9ASTR
MSVVKLTPSKVFPKKLSTTSLVKESIQQVNSHLDKFDICIKDQTVIYGIHYGSWGVSHIKDAYEEEVIPFVNNLRESFKLFEKGRGKSQVTPCETNLDSRFQKLDDENVSLAFMVSSLVKEREHLKIESEIINAYFKSNKAVHRDYLKVTKEHVTTLQELLEQARVLKTLDENLVYACKFAECIRDLLVYVSASCPFTQSGNEKVCYSNASGSKPKSNTKNDRIQRPSSRSQKNKVEAQLRKFKSSSNKNNHVSKCNANVNNVALLKNSKNVCLSCNECLFSANHDACVVKYLNDVQKRHRWVPIGRILSIEGTTSLLTKITPATIVPIVTRFQTICIPAVAPNAETRMRYSISKNSLIRAHINTYGHPFNKTNFALARNFEVPSKKFRFLTIVKIVLLYLDSSCSKHKTGQRDKLINFVYKFNSIVRFSNDHFAAIMVYGDLQIGNIMISRVYYVEGLGHNLFFVGQFCDSDLEVAFRKHTCFVRNLVGVDLLSRSRGSNLYTISMEEIMKSSPICLPSKASKTKSWLWYCHM